MLGTAIDDLNAHISVCINLCVSRLFSHLLICNLHCWQSDCDKIKPSTSIPQ